MIQLQFLNYLLTTKDYSIITLNNITEDYFSEYKDEFRFIRYHNEQYGNVPDFPTFLVKFPKFDVLDVKENPNFLLKELIQDLNTRRLANTFNRVRNYLMNNQIEEAMEAYKRANENLINTNVINSVDIIHNTQRYDDYVKRLNNFDKYFVKTGFKELDNIIGGWDKEEELAVIVARSGIGKCLEKGTTVLMEDGTLKKVEEIKVGDKVQSYGRINTVQDLHNGISKGYKIIPNLGEPFIVSENHILTFMQLKDTYAKDNNQIVFSNNYQLIDMTVEDYLNSSKATQARCKLFYPRVEYPTKQLNVNPYILGLWLGNGNPYELNLVTTDKEVNTIWKDYTSSHQNLLLDLFKQYKLFNNKHIPLDYLTSDRHQRLELLAGILDSKGRLTKHKNCFELTFKNKTFIKQVRQLAIGLGFRVGKVDTKSINKTHYRIYITGNLKDIPIRVSHKIPTSTTDYKYQLSLTGFRIEQVERVEYYGFMCNGDSRYILGNGILTHNTWCLLKSALAAAEQGLTVGLYSGEMSEKKVGYRIDTLLGHISNGALIHGNESVQADYQEYIKELPNKVKGSIKIITPVSLNGPATVSALRAFIEKEKIDILFIDQLSLLDDERHARNPVERATNISKDLKILQTLKKIPIISVSQQNRSKLEGEEDTIDTSQLSMSDRIGQDATSIIGIMRDKKDNHVFKLCIVKSRDNENNTKLSYYVDLNLGTFKFIPENESDLGDSRYDVENDDGEDVF